MHHEAGTDIERPADEVWACLADLRNDVHWRGVESSESTAGAVGAAGARYRQVVAGTRRDQVVTVETTEADPVARTVVVVTLDDPGVTQRAAYVVTETGSGTSRVRLSLDLEPHGWWRAVAPLLRGRVRRMADLQLRSLRAHLEHWDDDDDLGGARDGDEDADGQADAAGAEG